MLNRDDVTPWFGKLLQATLHRIGRGPRKILRPCAYAALPASALPSLSAAAPYIRHALWYRHLHARPKLNNDACSFSRTAGEGGPEGRMRAVTHLNSGSTGATSRALFASRCVRAGSPSSGLRPPSSVKREKAHCPTRSPAAPDRRPRRPAAVQ